MISDVIGLEMQGRLYIFVSTFYMLSVMQANMRAFYKKVSPFVTLGTNDKMFYVGFTACFSMPLIGIFDEHMWRPVHYLCAITFFSTFGIYAIWIARTMFAHRESYPEEEQRSIRIM